MHVCQPVEVVVSVVAVAARLAALAG